MILGLLRFKTLCVCCKYMFMASTFLYQCGLVSANTRGVAESISDGNVVFWQVWCSALRFKLKDNAIMYWNFSIIYIHIIIGVCFLDDWRCPPLAVDVLMMWMLHWFHGRSKAVLIFWAILMFEEKWGFWKKFHKRIDSNRLNIRWLYNSSVIILMFCLKKDGNIFGWLAIKC